ncbi:hypothetical protein [Nocardia sp. NPDC050710]
MGYLIPLLIVLLAVAASVVVASYTTVMATYWFELRHRDHTDPPDVSAAR